MAGITLAQAQEKLDIYMEALSTLAAGKQYTINTGVTSRTLTRADENFVYNQVLFWDKMVKRLSRGGTKVKGITPVDS